MGLCGDSGGSDSSSDKRYRQDHNIKDFEDDDLNQRVHNAEKHGNLKDSKVVNFVEDC